MKLPYYIERKINKIFVQNDAVLDIFLLPFVTFPERHVI